MECVICGTNKRLNNLMTENHGTVNVCGRCVSRLVEGTIEDREQKREVFCRGCQHYTDNGCTQHLTPMTCC
jgi:hypothetical protein